MDSPLDSQNTTSHVKSWKERDQERHANTPEGIAGRQLAKMMEEIKKLQDDLNGFRITGAGVSGQGPRGIMIESTASASNSITVRICVNGSAQNQSFVTP